MDRKGQERDMKETGSDKEREKNVTGRKIKTHFDD